ncbi:MAG: hypothetical protein OEN21_13015 [Myxococcales bacterium]|nr:hypothetical protein [Myxococcales bacterium]
MRWIAFLVFGALTAFGCVGTTDTGEQSETGSLSVDLLLAGGVEIDTVGWQITGNGMDMSGDINVSAPGSTASVEVFGLPPGKTDYTVTLTATSNDKEATCKGSAPFNVEIGETTNVMVILNCKKQRTLGGVRVNGKFNICTELTKAVVSPLQTSVGNDISLSAQASDEEGDPITYSWTGTGGSIADPTAASTTFTCQEVGDHSVTIMVTDNDVYCRMATWTIPVTCVEGDRGDLCEDVECEDDGNECTATECNPANGACETSNVADGTECDGGTCSGGVCVEVDLCEGADCDDQNECTADDCDPADGTCGNTNVDNGTPCNDDEGVCSDGSCVDVNLCAGVVCDDTGNDCTVAMCNNATGECDTMNVTDGTECNGGNGACSAGECIDNNLCQGVDCTSANECVQDGDCDPATGNCIAGDNEPAETACNADSGDICDGAGNCVACISADQCPDDGNDCTAAACETNACVQNNVIDGQACDFGGSDGICEAGTCVEAPQCVSPGDCDDGNPCTVGDCPDGMCVFSPIDGGSCDVSPGVPGTCSGGGCVGLCVGVDCTSGSQCVMDGTCDDQSGNCVAGGNEPADTICSETGGSVCDGNGACVECNSDIQCDVELSEICVDNTCMAGAAPTCNLAQTGSDTPQSEIVSQACTNSVTTAQSPFPYTLIVDVPVPVIGGAGFTANLGGIGVFPEFFLDAAQGVVPGGVNEAILEDFLATVQVRSGATGPDVGLTADISSLVPGPTSFCTFPFDQVCAVDGDCLVPPCLPPVNLATIPNSTDCSVGGVCDTLGKKVSQCDLNGFCVTGDLVIELQEQTGIAYTADASGSVLWGWGDTGVPGLLTCPDAGGCGEAFQVDGCYDLPAAVFSNPLTVPGSGIRVNVAGALFVAIQCVGATDGGICASGEGCVTDADCATAPCIGVGVDDDVVCPTPDADLISCPIN